MSGAVTNWRDEIAALDAETAAVLENIQGLSA